MADPTTAQTEVRLPRVTIQFCTQCKWNLRAAYYSQELLQTFSTSLGEISLQPSSGGVFKVDIYTTSPSPSTSSPLTIQHTPLWDRKSDGGFPETKELKRRVRDVIEPGRNLGHVDKDYTNKPPADADKTAAMPDVTNQPAPSNGADKQTPRPRPRDIAAKAPTLTHPPDAPQPAQEEWGTHEGERTVPGGGGFGGTKPGVGRATPVPKDQTGGKKDEQMKIFDGEETGESEEKKCEDCQ